MNNPIGHKMYLVAALFLVFCAACFSGCINEGIVVPADQNTYEWMNTEMTDVITGETFTLAELANEAPIVVHIFATWCPACNVQLEESTKFLGSYPGKAHILSLNIDSRETPAFIADHVAQRGFGGRHAVAENPVVQGFTDLFGPTVGIPRTIIIHGGTPVDLGSGVFRSAAISSHIDAISQQQSTATAKQEGTEWMGTKMTNAITKDTFTLSELTQDGTPIVVHLVATWCSYCNVQFGESTTFLENYPGKAHVVLIGIDTNENSEVIANHASSKGYAGIFTTAEVPVMQGFINFFGPEIMMSIPQAIIISGNDLLYLGPGVLKSDDIANRIDLMYQHIGK